MHSELTQDQVNFFQTNGYLVVPDLLDADELATWRDAVEEAVAQRGTRTHPHSREDDLSEQGTRLTEEQEYFRKVLTQRVNLWKENEKVRRLVLDPRLGKLAADLAGVDAIRMWHDQALIKQPYGNFTAYHVDNLAHSFNSANEITIWVALDDATLENGCLYYVPGSHKNASHDIGGASIGKDLGAMFDIYPELKDVPTVACPVPAGGACFHNGLTAHGAGANMTHGRRLAMASIYMPDGSTFNGLANMLPPGYLATLKIGDVLDNDEQNPLVYSRNGKPTAAFSPPN